MNFLDFLFPVKPLVNLFTDLGNSVTKVNNGSWSVGDSFWHTMNSLTGGSFDNIGNFWKDISGQSTQEKINEQNLAFSREQFDYQKSIDAFNKNYTLNQNQYMVKDMQNAGLNPIAISGSTGSSVSSSGASAPNLQAGPSTLSALLPLLSLGADMFNSSKSRKLQQDSINNAKDSADKTLTHQQDVLAFQKTQEQNNASKREAEANLTNAQAAIQWQTARHLQDYGTLPGTDNSLLSGANNLIGGIKKVGEKVSAMSDASFNKIMKDMDRNVFNIYYNTDGSFGEFVNKELNGRPLQSLTLGEMKGLFGRFYGGKK